MKHLYPLLLLLLPALPSFAKHIIGGVMSYECLGGGNYFITLKMYRDCSDPTGAGFDFNAPFTIFQENANGTYTELTTLHLSPDIITDIDPDTNPCVEVPPNVCVEEGIYSFNYQIPNWPSSNSIHISYQRCCRNVTITNIVNPDDVGATFTVEITPESQLLCNNSPKFNTLPPVVICVNEPLVYDHSAFDAEGDQLVYEFCSPLLGGGPPGSGGGNCGTTLPDPACPPPYDEATFVNPPYSSFNPMGGNPQISINPVTGVLTGTPNVQGQFVVAICIKEYRNGQLLSTIRRDFQFNVTICEDVVEADLNAGNMVVDGKNFFITTCYDLEIPFENLSTNNANVDSLLWQFDLGGTLWSSSEWDITVGFPSAGSYMGSLTLNPGSQCSDTANIFLEIYPELIADFSYDYDTCVAGPVSFVEASYINGVGQIAKWEWQLDAGATDTIQRNPVFAYQDPGVTPVTLTVWDGNGCSDDTNRLVLYQPVPALILVKPNDTISCAPAKVLFNNLSSPIGPTYDIRWDFGDGNTSTDISPEHVYLDSGIFDVRLEITSPIGCYADTLFSELVKIVSPPIAGFQFEPANPSNLNPVVQFFDHSTDAVHWDWYVNGNLVSQQPDFAYSFPDTGLQAVTLLVVHPEYCIDTLTQYVDVEPKVTYFLPNAFTPNEDTVNDFFIGTGITRGITGFSMEVWNRYGQKVFETADINESWNGQINNNGRPAQNGIYTCVVRFTGPRGEPFAYRGYTTLLR